MFWDDSDEFWWEVSTVDHSGLVGSFYCRSFIWCLGMILIRSGGKYLLQIIYLVLRDNTDKVWGEVSTVDHLSGV